MKRLIKFWNEDSNNKRCVVMVVCFQILLWGNLFVLIFSPVNAIEFDVKSFLDKTYVKVGVGYKFREINLFTNINGVRTSFNEPLSARFEIGYQWSDNITIGYTHRSQWLSGMPEYYVDELFIDYKFSLGGFL